MLQAHEMSVKRQAHVVRMAFDDEVLSVIDLPKGALRLTRGPGSGLARRVGDPPGTFWAIGDRGPNMKIELAVGRYGLHHLEPFAALDGAKVMPRLDIGPSISELRVDGDRVSCIRSLPLRDRGGKRLSGRPIPGGFSEPAFALDGAAIEPDPAGADTEGLGAAADGTFWVADEYGPSLLHIASDGTVVARWVPEGTGRWFAGADYPVVEALPAIAIHRQLNRGFEGLALSPDETGLFVAFQSPLASPDMPEARSARHVRIWKIDLASATVVAEYLYPLDPPDSFRRDTALGKLRWKDLKISELVVLDGNRLLVLERGSATTKFYSVNVGPRKRVAARYRDMAHNPSIEAMSREKSLAKSIPVLSKKLAFSTDDHPEISPDLEGVVRLNGNSLLLVNDNDFGVEGVKTEFWKVTLAL